MNQTGIWIDSKKAVIITFKNKESNTKIIYSGVEGKNRVDGEGKEFGRFGDQFSTLEKKLEKKYQLEIIEYLKEVIKELESTDDLVLFGPAQVKIELKKLIEKDNKLLKKLLDVVDADSMTDNQLVAWVKKYYSI
ncbi:MAG: hypothetical protein COW67_06230 [Flavobacteriales bacterium CG18_big_fil_WC_8_21_14_2_50_32_9]|nr:MAG: hypothetical protein COW67_06230 [Flavobacteriales bacterium CG18_big_fil_WC_8_21_14_2_50_32_9]PJC61657.1 MAG: hypothetical protein CO022_08680 [Flavobacteriales bacterium CG_4_9_14_0_2_um_filter_32_27]